MYPVFPLQTLELPKFDFGAPGEMYVRFFGPPSGNVISANEIRLNNGSVATTDTYFNGFSVGVWKHHCTIDDLSLFVKGSGRVVVQFGLHRIGHAHRFLHEQLVTLGGDEYHEIELPLWRDLADGILYFSLVALEDNVVIQQAFYGTRTPVQRDVKLGLVVTHFNRKNYVIPAARRIVEKLLSAPYYSERISLVIVDNSSNLDPAEVAGAILLPNKNLGGSGGFTRGLMYLEDNGDFTHCLFMDDDASCEIESLRRAFAILSFAKDNKTAVAGGMLRELEPNRLFEKGAIFDGLCRPLKHNLDMCQIGDLLEAERFGELPNYGGWWFFAFSLEGFEHYPYPFFVRGDDSAFSMMNRFNLVTMNGIACWGDDFALKSGPMTYYLDTRYHILSAMVNCDRDKRWIAATVNNFFWSQLFSYCYGSAACITLALEHFVQGPRFWTENMDMAEIRKTIGAIPHSEVMQPINVDEIGAKRRNRRISGFARVMQRITLNGLLLPRFMLRNETIFQHKSFSGSKDDIYRNRWVAYEYVPTRSGFVTEHNSKRSLREIVRFIKAKRNFLKNFDQLKQDYAEAMPHLTSRAFWESVYPER